MSKFRSIAIHLPQFHPIPDNDRWWGKGFTEWKNVVKAKPLFEGHYQPHLPADLGYYDLRLPDARQAQADLARQFGIHGFCYYHYWFNGKRLLERPVEEILQSGSPDFPFMLCWANENWTRRWDGKDQEVLLAQKHSEEDDVAHLEYLIQYFNDPRYIRVNGKPVFVLYKPFLLPDATETALRWKRVAAKHGIELYLCYMVSYYYDNKLKFIDGFDAAINFEPFGIQRDDIFTEIQQRNKNSFTILEKAKSKLGLNVKRKYSILPYRCMYEQLRSVHEFKYKLFPSIVPGWDNTARRKDNPSLILGDSTPEHFQKWLEIIMADFTPYSDEENFIFINAWNEWAEGNHLEPCERWGCQYLEVVKKMFI